MLIITRGMYLLGEFGVLEKTRSFFFFKLILFLKSLWCSNVDRAGRGDLATNPRSGWLGGQSCRKHRREALGPGGGWGAGRAETPRRLAKDWTMAVPTGEIQTAHKRKKDAWPPQKPKKCTLKQQWSIICHLSDWQRLKQNNSHRWRVLDVQCGEVHAGCIVEACRDYVFIQGNVGIPVSMLFRC